MTYEFFHYAEIGPQKRIIHERVFKTEKEDAASYQASSYLDAYEQIPSHHHTVKRNGVDINLKDLASKKHVFRAEAASKKEANRTKKEEPYKKEPSNVYSLRIL